MSLNCIIVDDEWHGINLLAEIIEDYPMLNVKKTFFEAEEAIEYLKQEGDIDLVFSDIGMPKLDGLSAAKDYVKYCQHLVFVTGYRHLFKEAFQQKASGILLKPVFSEDFENLMNELIVN